MFQTESFVFDLSEGATVQIPLKDYDQSYLLIFILAIGVMKKVTLVKFLKNGIMKIF